MKKVALSLAVLFAAALVSCGGNKENKEEAATVDSAAVTEEVVDSAVTEAPADSAAVEAPATEAPADSVAK